MEIYWILLICLAAVVLFILVFFAIVSVLIQKTRFGVRSDGNPALRYFQAKDFENLQAEDISFVSDKGQTLRGCIYSDMRVKEPKGLVIWVHGFGAGHNAYTTEIAYLAAQGYLVLGYDNTGCVLSDGKGVGGLIQGAIDASYAVRYVQNEPRLKQYKRVLVGHYIHFAVYFEYRLRIMHDRILDRAEFAFHLQNVSAVFIAVVDQRERKVC